MPLTDSLHPPLEPEEREIVKSYDGWTNYMFSHGLKPWNDDDAKEGKAILEAMTEADKETEPGWLDEDDDGYENCNIDDCNRDENSSGRNDSDQDSTHYLDDDDDDDNYDGHDTEVAVDHYAFEDTYEDHDSHGGYEDYGGCEDYGDSDSDESYWDY
ncbi:hypothetical protein N7488_001451 [Penicillium malachiteum]|nr:hypothetical protein N7488_001451 [Penicillium malachiteum]